MKGKPRASIDIFGGEPTPVRFHDRANNGQTCPHPSWLGGIEMGEDLIRIVSGEPATVIAHTGYDRIYFAFCGNEDSTFFRRRQVRRFERIHQ